MNRSPGPATSAGGPAGDEQETALLKSISAGELGALETLYDRYRGIAYALALRITADTQLAEDVVQDAFLGVWRHSAHYTQSRASVRTWLLSIVHHRAIDVVRRRRPTSALPEGDDPVEAVLVAVDPWPEVMGRLDRESIHAALATLSDVQREAIELAYFGGLTHQEIAQRTGAPLGTVKSRVRLGLLALREVLVAARAVPDRAGGAA
jgi:RNA polymerase sigma-70 factor (ECF subfamily)